MSGRWVDSLPEVELPRDPETAALYLLVEALDATAPCGDRCLTPVCDCDCAACGQVIHDLRCEMRRPEALAQAGAIIRAWRKSLGVASKREPSHRAERTSDDLIRAAIHEVCFAASSASPFSKAIYPRQAEAALRTLWKRCQS